MKYLLLLSTAATLVAAQNTAQADLDIYNSILGATPVEANKPVEQHLHTTVSQNANVPVANQASTLRTANNRLPENAETGLKKNLLALQNGELVTTEKGGSIALIDNKLHLENLNLPENNSEPLLLQTKAGKPIMLSKSKTSLELKPDTKVYFNPKEKELTLVENKKLVKLPKDALLITEDPADKNKFVPVVLSQSKDRALISGGELKADTDHSEAAEKNLPARNRLEASDKPAAAYRSHHHHHTAEATHKPEAAHKPEATHAHEAAHKPAVASRTSAAAATGAAVGAPVLHGNEAAHKPADSSATHNDLKEQKNILVLHNGEQITTEKGGSVALTNEKILLENVNLGESFSEPIKLQTKAGKPIMLSKSKTSLELKPESQVYLNTKDNELVTMEKNKVTKLPNDAVLITEDAADSSKFVPVVFSTTKTRAVVSDGALATPKEVPKAPVAAMEKFTKAALLKKNIVHKDGVYILQNIKTAPKHLKTEKSAEEKKAEEKRAEEKRAEEKKAAEKRAEEKKAAEKKAEEKKAEEGTLTTAAHHDNLNNRRLSSFGDSRPIAQAVHIPDPCELCQRLRGNTANHNNNPQIVGDSFWVDGNAVLRTTGAEHSSGYYTVPPPSGSQQQSASFQQYQPQSAQSFYQPQAAQNQFHPQAVQNQFQPQAQTQYQPQATLAQQPIAQQPLAQASNIQQPLARTSALNTQQPLAQASTVQQPQASTVQQPLATSNQATTPTRTAAAAVPAATAATAATSQAAHPAAAAQPTAAARPAATANQAATAHPAAAAQPTAAAHPAATANQANTAQPTAAAQNTELTPENVKKIEKLEKDALEKDKLAEEQKLKAEELASKMSPEEKEAEIARTSAELEQKKARDQLADLNRETDEWVKKNPKYADLTREMRRVREAKERHAELDKEVQRLESERATAAQNAPNSREAERRRQNAEKAKELAEKERTAAQQTVIYSTKQLKNAEERAKKDGLIVDGNFNQFRDHMRGLEAAEIQRREADVKAHAAHEKWREFAENNRDAASIGDNHKDAVMAEAKYRKEAVDLRKEASDIKLKKKPE